MAKLKRKYVCKDVDMVIASRTVAENFISHQAEIVKQRPQWADPFIQNFIERIDNAMVLYLGHDPKQPLKEATGEVHRIQEKAYKDLSMLKVQIEADFAGNKLRRDAILKTLGYSKDFIKSKQNQQMLSQLLFTYNKGMTPGLQAELTGKGVNPALIEDIKGYGKILLSSNTSQESLKGTTKKLTANAIEEFNGIYDQTIALCEVSRKILHSTSSLSKGMFSFRKIISNLRKQKASEEAEKFQEIDKAPQLTAPESKLTA